jgi:two-component system NtrC family response regulator
MVQEGRFREDLLFRIRAMQIVLPPLRERERDVRELATHFMTKYCERYGMATKGVSPEFIEALAVYDWPGNVRELMHAVENILATAGDDPVLYPKHFPTPIRIALARASVEHDPEKQDNGAGGKADIVPLKVFREALLARGEKDYLENLMAHTGWSVKDSCEISGLSRPRLYALLKKHGISRDA